MWSRKDLKKKGKAALRGSYWAAVAICFLLAFGAGEFANSVNAIHQQEGSHSNYEVVMERLDGRDILVMEGEGGNLLQEGIKFLFNSATGQGSWIFRILAGGLFLVGALLNVLFKVLVAYPLQVGSRRFALVARRERSQVLEVGFPFHRGRYGNVVKTMFLRDLSVSLWTLLLIFPGICKAYSYRLVPFLLAEDPTLSPREALGRSAQLMGGHRWQAFWLDVSFLGWHLLCALTFGLTAIFWSNPYILATNTELYAALREGVAADRPAVPPMSLEQRLATCRTWYGLSNYVLFFFTFSAVGWLWEVGLHLVQFGEFVNRGTMTGPWLPIYGSGGVIVLLLLRRWFHKPIPLFFMSMALCSAIEYASSWVLETATGLRWWDYSDYFLNLNGRICLEGAVVFGLGCCAAVYLVAPALGKVYDRIPKGPKTVLCALLLAAFGADAGLSVLHPNTGEGITALPVPREGSTTII